MAEQPRTPRSLITETTTTTTRRESQERSSTKKNYLQTSLYHPQFIQIADHYNQSPNNQQQQQLQQPIIIQVVSRDEIEQPLKLENERLTLKLNLLVQEHQELQSQYQSLQEQLQDRQTYIETYKSKYMDMENSKQLLVSELEKLNQQLISKGQPQQVQSARHKTEYSDNFNKLEIEKLKSIVSNKEDELRRMKDKYNDLECHGMLILQEKLVVVSNEKEYWKQKYSDLSQRTSIQQQQQVSKFK